MDILERAFAKMGARIKYDIARPRVRGGQRMPADLALDVRQDRRGEYFLISRAPQSVTDLVVLDVQAKERHLVLMSRNANEKHRYLLGHDERHWFVAGIPESTPVSRVRDAKAALKPEAVLAAEHGLGARDRDRRSNGARVRQGEWFFVPMRSTTVDAWKIMRNESLVRSRGGKPHICEQLFRFGGETVYVSPGFPNGLTEEQYAALPEIQRSRHNWRVMRRNPKAYVRGTVRHPDHKTVALDGWHDVLSNTEHLSFAMRDIVFLD